MFSSPAGLAARRLTSIALLATATLGVGLCSDASAASSSPSSNSIPTTDTSNWDRVD